MFKKILKRWKKKQQTNKQTKNKSYYDDIELIPVGKFLNGPYSYSGIGLELTYNWG